MGRPSKLNPITVRRGRYGELTIHEVSDEELTAIERAAREGTPDSIFLNFALSLASIFASLSVALLTTTIDSPRVFAAFVAVTFAAGVIALVLFALWLRSRRVRQGAVSALIQAIRDRLPPPEGTQVGPPAPRQEGKGPGD